MITCFHLGCTTPAQYMFHSGGLCIVHAAEARQNAPQLVLSPITPDDEPTDPNATHVTRPVGSDYPDDE